MSPRRELVKSLWDVIPGPQSCLAEVTFSTGWTQGEAGRISGRAKWHSFLYTPAKCNSDALGLPFFSGTKVLDYRAARPALPPLLMNEGEPTLDLGLEVQRGRTRVELSLETEDSAVS